MNFKTLVLKQDWETVWQTLTAHYPKEVENHDAYQQLFDMIRTSETNICSFEIYLRHRTEKTIGKHEGVDVTLGVPKNERQVAHWPLELARWYEWLGLKVEEISFVYFTEPEIVVHCFYEISQTNIIEGEVREQNPRSYWFLNEVIKTIQRPDFHEQERRIMPAWWSERKKIPLKELREAWGE
jgi:hypothetical protein